MSGHKQKKKVLVLGATGRVARLLRRQIEAQPLENTEFFWVSRRMVPGVDQVFEVGGDVDLLPQCNAVLALWGAVSGGVEALNGNISLAHEAQRIARACGADRVLHASSSAVYAPSLLPISETGECAPRNAYGAAKLRMERALKGAVPRAVCLRIGNVAGADGLLSIIADTPSVTLIRFPDGRGPVRSYLQLATFAHVVDALVRLPVRDLPEILNVAGIAPVAMEELVRATGCGLEWRPAPQGALPVMALDVARLTSLVDLSPPSTDAGEIVGEWRRIGQHP
ncbi:NAD(P)-dependent oxidoreductase [Marinovum sp.]|uniref:NAD-dependent epimerase/dehydratase family protein n=1 Tax=Marinovum sp. TaxID=2024839 RepID=UPI002B26F32B|nr:NAD(P)-dependent oxidoreductase [Marinovum sp.]